MEILTKTLELEYNGEVTLELIENFFKTNDINPVRWAIVNARGGLLTIAYASFE